MNPGMERFDVLNGILRRNGLPMILPKGLVFQTLLRAGWKGTDGTLPEEVARYLVERGPFHVLFQESRGNGKIA